MICSHRTLGSQVYSSNGQKDIELVDATDVHGYNPSMAGVSACMDHEVVRPGMSRHAAMQHASTASGGNDSTGRAHTAGIAPTADLKPAKVSPKVVAAAPTRREGQRPKAPSAEGKIQSLVHLAKQAHWASKSAKVVFGSDRVPEAGSVRVIKKGRLADGHMAADLLCTQPDWKKEGYLQGVFPALKIGAHTHFRSTAALLKGAGPADALSFGILIKEGRSETVVKELPLRGNRRVSLDADLSKWQGKRAQLILRVRRLKGAKSLPAVWINPVLVDAP